jgi:TorA maturation chaperone TorD
MTLTLPDVLPHATAVDLALQLVAGAYRAPTDALVADLHTGEVAAAVEALADEVGVPAPLLARPDLPTLQASHVALFVTSIGGLPAPPYVGLAADGELLGPSAEALAGFYAHHGIAPSPTWHDLPDHVSAVAQAGLLLLAAGRTEAASALLTRFIGPWFVRYAAAVDAADVSGFYGPLTRFLNSVVLEVSREAAT